MKFKYQNLKPISLNELLIVPSGGVAEAMARVLHGQRRQPLSALVPPPPATHPGVVAKSWAEGFRASFDGVVGRLFAALSPQSSPV